MYELVQVYELLKVYVQGLLELLQQRLKRKFAMLYLQFLHH